MRSSAAAVLALAAAGAMAGVASSAAKHNVVFVFLDDLDVEMQSSSAEYMPQVHKLLTAEGATFTRMYASVPVCCPSRSSLYTGTYQHNNHVTGNGLDTNCSSAAWQAGPELDTIATRMSAAGVRSSFVGKYLNDYGAPSVGGASHVPPGWSEWAGLLGNSAYLNFTMSINGVAEKHKDDFAVDYLPTIVRNRTLAFIDASVAAGQQFFAYMSFPSCHGPQEAEPQYRALYPDVRAPRTPNYNATVADSHWLQAVQGVYGLDANAADFADLVYRRRLQTLKSVDDAVVAVVEQLTALGVLDDTFLVLSADNGFHTGTFGLIYDKRQPWETDTHLPLFIRGPGVAPGVAISALASMPDLSATFLDMVGAPIPAHYDGVSLMPLFAPAAADAAAAAAAPPSRVINLVEYHGESDGGGSSGGGACARTAGAPMFCNPDGTYALPPFFHGSPVCVCQDATNNTYSCLRGVNATADYRYCEFADAVGRVEYFDFRADPYELVNRAAALAPGVRAALSARLAAATTCVGAAACEAVLGVAV